MKFIPSLTAALASLVVSAPAIAADESAIARASGIPTPAATIIRAACPDMDASATTDACTYPDGRIYVGARGLGRFAMEHELGHLFIVQYLDSGERNKATRLVGLPRGTPWFNGTGLGGFRSPDELTADAYAACRLRMDPNRGWETAYDYYPSSRDLRTMCGFLVRASS